jgi:Tat protein translocase TatB subunit
LFLFIFESIGTSELLLVGVIALIFLGPRRMPELARKLGKMMSEFRGTANEFRETWEREVDFESELKAFDPDSIDAESKAVPRISSISPESENVLEPVITEADPAALERLKAEAQGIPSAADSATDSAAEPPHDQDSSDTLPPLEPTNDKRNWL